MCFDIGIATCGPNEALVISGMFQVNFPYFWPWEIPQLCTTYVEFCEFPTAMACIELRLLQSFTKI